MADPTPEPGSPEALVAAHKIKNLFLVIVLANVVLLIVVFLPKRPNNAAPVEPPPPTKTAPAP